jgi:hypothetical protein
MGSIAPPQEARQLDRVESNTGGPEPVCRVLADPCRCGGRLTPPSPAARTGLNSSGPGGPSLCPSRPQGPFSGPEGFEVRKLSAGTVSKRKRTKQNGARSGSDGIAPEGRPSEPGGKSATSPSPSTPVEGSVLRRVGGTITTAPSTSTRRRLAVRLRLAPSPPSSTFQLDRYSPCRAHEPSTGVEGLRDGSGLWRFAKVWRSPVASAPGSVMRQTGSVLDCESGRFIAEPSTLTPHSRFPFQPPAYRDWDS